MGYCEIEIDEITPETKIKDIVYNGVAYERVYYNAYKKLINAIEERFNIAFIEDETFELYIYNGTVKDLINRVKMIEKDTYF